MALHLRREQVRGLYAQGLTHERIGARLGVTRDTVGRDLAELGLTTRRPSRLIAAERRRRASNGRSRVDGSRMTEPDEPADPTPLEGTPVPIIEAHNAEVTPLGEPEPEPTLLGPDGAPIHSEPEPFGFVAPSYYG